MNWIVLNYQIISQVIFLKKIKNYICCSKTGKDYKKIKPYIESIYEENTHWIHEIIKGNRKRKCFISR